MTSLEKSDILNEKYNNIHIWNFIDCLRHADMTMVACSVQERIDVKVANQILSLLPPQNCSHKIFAHNRLPSDYSGFHPAALGASL